MAAITLEYNARNSLANRTIEYILSLGVFNAKVASKPKTGLDRAIDELKNGNTVRCSDFNDYLEKVK
ncbi:MAG: hypothetical protein LBR64_07060 [Dysgonamonadaceae bacterium]|nr:hypothetical protein [Dysgonamonadaceae bacterium]